MNKHKEHEEVLREDDNSIVSESLDMVMNWKPVSDVFALKNFMYASAFTNGGSAVYINAHFRKVLKLKNHAFMASLIPVVLTPALVGGLLHHQFVQRPMLLQTFKCPVCIEMRGGLVQFFSGIVYPMMLAPLAGFQFAARLYTYPVPDARKPLSVVKEIAKITRPFLSKLYILAGINIIAGVAWTHWEFHNLYTVAAKMAQMEEELKEHHKGKLSL
ncbi:transmembrane protein 126A-like [Eriocheir sinensis]|uniref:transmembrane protein 126A-like n=1 Tax=Eriocheir sinensis TaxID=95602 RepID=UPI0021CA7729|nr:transmembrane protein 126A-like [Eriocheir sinensis]XP_050719339.1 transmembrane protein 126A-like [Eriocheir sinensis]